MNIDWDGIAEAFNNENDTQLKAGQIKEAYEYCIIGIVNHIRDNPNSGRAYSFDGFCKIYTRETGRELYDKHSERKKEIIKKAFEDDNKQ